MGFKKQDLQNCIMCGQGVAHGGQITFYQVTAQYYALDPRGIRETHGMETMMGGGQQGAALAAVLGTDPDIAQPLGERVTFLLCQNCAIESHALVPRALEIKAEQEESGDGDAAVQG